MSKISACAWVAWIYMTRNLGAKQKRWELDTWNELEKLLASHKNNKPTNFDDIALEW